MHNNLVSVACVLFFACLVAAIIPSPLNTRVYIGGKFSSLNGTAFNNIAFYDLRNSTLRALENGTDGEVKVVNVDAYGNLYIGGSFTQVGSRKTGPFAIWNAYTSSWIDTGLTADNFTVGSVVTAIDTDCASLPTAPTLSGMPQCNIFVGGNFELTLSGTTAKNITYYHNRDKAWKSFVAANIASVSVIAKNELQVSTSSKVYIGGKFTNAGTEYSFAIYDTSKTDSSAWEFVAGVSGVTDIYYNPNVFSTDNIFISANSFTEATCKGICNYNHKKKTWSSDAGSVTTGTINKIRYIKGLSATNTGSIFIGGNGMSGSTVKRRDGNGEFTNVGTNGPTETVLGMDICGFFSQYTITGCKSGSVAVGGQNFFKFFDTNANQWRDLLSESGYVINSIYITKSSAVTSSVSFALLAIVAIVCFFF